MGGKKSPDPPDYAAAAREQAEASREITDVQNWANRPDQFSPWGSITWDAQAARDPATGDPITRWTQNLQLTPEQQAALDAQMRIQSGRSGLAETLLGRSEDEFGQPVDWSQYTELGAVPESGQYAPGDYQEQLDYSGLQDVDPSQRYFDEAGDALYGQATSRLDPQWQQRASDLESKLWNQGLRPGDEAYERAMDNFNRARNDAYQQAQFGATIGAGQEASRMYGMDLGLRGQQFQEAGAAGQFANEATRQAFADMLRGGGQQFGEEMQGANYQNRLRQQQIAEGQQRRNYSLNEINAILTGQQVAQPNMPDFSYAQRSETPQMLAAANMGWNADMDVMNANRSFWNDIGAGIGAVTPWLF